MRAGRFAAEALARSRGGNVASVFPHAAIVRLDDGSLVALLSSGTPVHPWAVVLPVPALSPDVLRPGDAVSIDLGFLSAGSFRISLSDLSIVELTLDSRPTPMSPDVLLRTVGIVRGAAKGVSLSGPVEDFFDPVIARTLERFERDRDAAVPAALVGLGGGLTPSGDDLLVGILAALDWVSASEADALSRRERLVSALPQPLDRYTPGLSSQMLQAAIEGHYPEPLVNLAAALAGPEIDGDRVEREVARVAVLGHRSGRDILQGFLAGLACTLSPPGGKLSPD